jgi:hypothetical protein
MAISFVCSVSVVKYAQVFVQIKLGLSRKEKSAMLKVQHEDTSRSYWSIEPRFLQL